MGGVVRCHAADVDSDFVARRLKLLEFSAQRAVQPQAHAPHSTTRIGPGIVDEWAVGGRQWAVASWTLDVGRWTRCGAHDASSNVKLPTSNSGVLRFRVDALGRNQWTGSLTIAVKGRRRRTSAWDGRPSGWLATRVAGSRSPSP